MIKLTNILQEIMSEKVSDDPYKYYRHVKRIEKLLNIKVTDFMARGTRPSVFSLKDGRVLKLTSDTADVAGLKYAMDHPKYPVVKVYDLVKMKIGEDATGDAFERAMCMAVDEYWN